MFDRPDLVKTSPAVYLTNRILAGSIMLLGERSLPSARQMIR